MAGYADDFSKSNNAKDAERNGRFPASVVARKLGVPTAYIRSIGTSEWHHSSKFYNVVEYFSLEECAEWLASDEGKEDYATWRSNQEPATTKEYTGCNVTWLEWYGTRRHPRAKECSAEGCTVKDTGGAFYEITLPGGEVLKKRKDCRGLEIVFGSQSEAASIKEGEEGVEESRGIRRRF